MRGINLHVIINDFIFLRRELRLRVILMTLMVVETFGDVRQMMYRVGRMIP